jgi:hypothetical protein
MTSAPVQLSFGWGTSKEVPQPGQGEKVTDSYNEKLSERLDEIAETAYNIIESGPSEQWTMAETAIVAEYRDLQKYFKENK